MSILRWANAVNYAVRDRASLGLRIGTVDLSHPPAIDQDGTARYDSGVPFYSVQEDLEERGVLEASLADGVKGAVAMSSRRCSTASATHGTGRRSVVSR
jgi:hypothetical protein